MIPPQSSLFHYSVRISSRRTEPGLIWSAAACESRCSAVDPEIRRRRFEGPPLSPKRNVRRENDLGEACLALSSLRSRSGMRLRKRAIEKFDYM
jgi:hypothetical protein